MAAPDGKNGKCAGLMAIGHRSDVGRVRTINEDSYTVVLPPEVPRRVLAVVAVADGMGGHQAGEVASALAIETISAGLRRKIWPYRRNRFQRSLKELVEKANREILSAAAEGSEGMGTTLTLAAIMGKNLLVAHVGDSRAYLLRDGVMKQLTQDHSWVAEEFRAGRLTEREAESHPRRNLLTRALGAESSVLVDTYDKDLRPGDRILLCSDGLHGVLRDDDIKAGIIQHDSPDEACQDLINQANQRGGPDNVTAIVVRFGASCDSSSAATVPMEVHSSDSKSLLWTILATVAFSAAGALVAWWVATTFLIG